MNDAEMLHQDESALPGSSLAGGRHRDPATRRQGLPPLAAALLAVLGLAVVALVVWKLVG